MNLQSPTSLLNSIQFMRSKLRSDKQALMNIKNDFSQIGKKQRPPPIETILQESIKENSQQNMSISKDEYSTDRSQKVKMIQMKRDYQKEINNLKKQHQKQIQELVEGFSKEKQVIEKEKNDKIEEQAKYIVILQEQISSPIQSERETTSKQQYDSVINQLLQQNNRLHLQLEQARDESEQWRRQAKQLWSEIEVKSRLKFSSKIPKDRIIEGSKNHPYTLINQAKSVYLRDENTDRSNISSQWSDISIKNDEGKLRTIKQFSHCISQLEPTNNQLSKMR